MCKRRVVSVFVLCLIGIFSFAQKNVEFSKENFTDTVSLQKAIDAINEGDVLFKKAYPNYEQARLKYEEANSFNPNNATLNYKIAKCYHYTYNYKKAIEFYEKAEKIDADADKLITYYLGQVYQQDYRFDQAAEKFKAFKESLSDYENLKFAKDVDKRIKECNLAKEAVENPVRVEIVNLGSTVNSSFHDHSPVISIGGDKLYFTSKREGASSNEIDYDNQYCEDIYVAVNNGTEWISVKNLGKPVNNKVNNASVSMTLDGKTLIICSEGDIYSSKFVNGKWSKPEPFADVINTERHESTACLSYDGNYLYFVSDKIYDNRGGTDIFFSRKNPDGTWSDAENIGDVINTPYNEDFVFMHPDGKTMFFGSKGHNSIGGYDVFKSVRQKDGSWSEPENLGYPVNTPADDVSFVMTPDGKEAYFASTRDGGFGYSDIYKVTFLPPEPPQKEVDTVVEEPEQEEVTMQLTIVKGKVLDTLGKKPVPIMASIDVVDNETGDLITTVMSSKDGDYLLSLPSGKDYGLAVKNEDYLFYSENFNIEESESYQVIEKNFYLMKMEKDNTIVLKNVFFDFGKATLKPQSYKELDRLIKILQDNPKMSIEIGGHTDNQSSRAFNLKLSEERAKAVVDYLSKDIDTARLAYKGYAFDMPIAPNDTEEGRAQNRRVEFKIISTK